MEGEGPVDGDPPRFLVLGGSDPVAVDAAATTLMDVEPRETGYLWQCARRSGPLRGKEVAGGGRSLGVAGRPCRPRSAYAEARGTGGNSTGREDMNLLEQFGDPRINRRAEVDPLLREVLEKALAEIQGLLVAHGRPFRLRVLLTREGEYLLRMEVAYADRAERDRIWDEAAQALERARAGRPVHILCGIARLNPEG